MSKAPKDYNVGYARPPAETRFKAGKSGNPAGRPPGSKNMATWVKEELARKVDVVQGGEAKRLPKGRIIVLKQIDKAMNGSERAFASLMKLEATAAGLPTPVGSGGTSTELPPEQYTAMLADLVQRRMQEEVGDDGDPD